MDLSYGDIFAQQFVKGSGLDLKAYVVGDEVFGVARPFPVRTAEEKRGEPRTISPEVRDICLRCGELFDLELYGVDLIETEESPYVIEVNCFLATRVPEADRLLAEYIFERAANSGSPETRGSKVPQAVESST